MCSPLPIKYLILLSYGSACVCVHVHALHFLLYLCVCVHDTWTFHVEDRGQPWCHLSGTVYLTFNFFEIGSLIDLELAKWSISLGVSFR